jgi:soluble lytic murein transglycosylase
MSAGVKPAALIHREVIHREVSVPQNIPATAKTKPVLTKSPPPAVSKQSAQPAKQAPIPTAQTKPATPKTTSSKPGTSKPVAKKKSATTAHHKAVVKKAKTNVALAPSSKNTSRSAPLSEAGKKKPSPAIHKTSQDPGSENP